MAVLDGSGGAGRHQGNSPEMQTGRRRRLSCERETERAGEGAAADGAEILQALQRVGG